MKLQHKLYLGLVAIFTILMVIGGLLFSQEYQKRRYTEQLVNLYQPALSASEGMISAFSELNSAVVRSLSPMVDSPQGHLLAAIELFNQYQNELSVLTGQVELSDLASKRLEQQFDNTSVLALVLVNQYQEMLKQQRQLEDNVDKLISLLKAPDQYSQPELLLLQNDLLRLSLYIASPLHRNTLYNKIELERLEQSLVQRVERIRTQDELAFTLDYSEMGYGVGEVRSLYHHMLANFDHFHIKRSQYQQAQQDLQRLLSQLHQQTIKKHELSMAQIQAVSRNNQRIEYVLIPLGIIIAGLLAFQTALRVRKPLNHLLEAIRFAQAGDFSYRIDTSSHDEVAQLAGHFNEMMDRLGSITVSRAYLQQVLDTVHHGVIVTDHLFDIRFINAAAEYFFPEKAYVEGSIFNCRTEDGAMLLTASERQILQQQKRLTSIEKVVILPTGYQVILTLSVTELLINDACHWVLSLHDISQIKETEKNLQLYAKVFETSNDAIVISSKHNVVEQVNPAFSRITGFEPEEVVGKNPSVLSSGKQDREFYREMWTQLLMKGCWQGEIWNRRKNGEVYAEWLSIVAIHNELGLIERFVGVFSDITQRKEAEQLIHRQANYDALTELPNRRLFWDRLSQALLQAQANESQSSEAQVALLYVDLDGFKPVNDTFGHEYGDLLLKQVAVIMKSLIRITDTVARLGGDEFALILPSYSRAQLREIAHSIVDQLKQPIMVKDKLIYIGASVGISIYPELANDQEALVHQADSAMYYVKNKSKSSFAIYNSEMEVVAYERIQLEQDLRDALNKGQIKVIFQPLYDAKSERIVSAEALLRWQHPVRGLLMPDLFIPLAEETGIIHSLGEWTLREICKQAVGALSDIGFVRVAVNISPKQFAQADFVIQVENILRETGFPAQYLELEVTERLIINDLNATASVLKQLSEIGVSVVVDDFGIGYASLNDLRQYPVTELKFDRSFIKDVCRSPQDSGMIRSMAELAHQMGMKVVAEGVEDSDSLALLKQMGCDFIQGFVYHEPMAMSELVQLLEDQEEDIS